MDCLILSLFCLVLIICVSMNISIVWALLIGLILFLLHGLYRGFTVSQLLRVCLDGVMSAKNILLTFILIGMMTALWRASGCIPSIICYASDLIQPAVFVLLVFILNAIVSVLTGTAFGTAATMGVISISIANSMHMPLFWVGGAMLSGAYFGDRCSAVSTSAYLVSEITNTDIYKNIKNMIRTALIPTIITCIAYLAIGYFLSGTAEMMDVKALFQKEFKIGLVCLIPAICIITAVILKISVKKTMAISIVAAFIVSILYQAADYRYLLYYMVMGYSSSFEDVGAVIDGGGIISMSRPLIIVSLSSCYAGIFKATKILDFLQKHIASISNKFGDYRTMLAVSIFTSGISCNQTLSILLTQQLCSDLNEDKERFALNLEDSAVITSPIIPWSIAGTLPLASAGAPDICILGACFLFALPVWNVFWRKY